MAGLRNKQRRGGLKRSDSAGELNVAVVIHLFYEDQWEEFLKLLLNIPQAFALYVSLKPESLFESTIRRSFPDAVVRSSPNIGRDVAPFLAFLPELQSYDVVCKLHTKRSEGGRTIWRQELSRGLIGTPETVGAYLDAFAKDHDLVLAGPRFSYVDGPNHTAQTKHALALQHGPMPERWGFFAGTMFWCRPQLYLHLHESYPKDAFVAHEDIDGHPEHALERVFGLLACQSNKKVMLWDGIASIDFASGTSGNTNFYEEAFKGFEQYKPQRVEHSAQHPPEGQEPTLTEIHHKHRDVASVKFRGNIENYERVTKEFRNKEIRLLQIGIQNAGSLQIWSKYFANGRIFIGCSSNEADAMLRHSDPRIKVICAESSTAIVKTRIMELCGQFDLVIDDGSHSPGEIIRTFIQYFPCILEQGAYVIEDLRSSHLSGFGREPDHAVSSLAFFRRLTEVISLELGHEKQNVALHFEDFEEAYDIEIETTLFNSISSIEFTNSMIIVRKRNTRGTLLEERIASDKVAQTTEKSVAGGENFIEEVSKPKPQFSGISSSMEQRISVSVVIPFYNGSPYLPDAIRSVLEQTQPPREIIVVDDGSITQEASWLATFSKDAGFRVITQKNAGQGGARNSGVKNASGSHICFLDQDDIFLPGHIETLIDHWESVTSDNYRLGWVFADLSSADEDLNVISHSIFPYPTEPIPQTIDDCLSRDLSMYPSATMIDRHAFLDVGGFDPRLRGYEDDDLFLRMFISGYRTSFCSKDLTCYRLHEDQTTRHNLFLESMRIFYLKWITYDHWKNPKQRTFARANLKKRVLRSLQAHLKSKDCDALDALIDFYREVEQAY